MSNQIEWMNPKETPPQAGKIYLVIFESEYKTGISLARAFYQLHRVLIDPNLDEEEDESYRIEENIEKGIFFESLHSPHRIRALVLGSDSKIIESGRSEYPSKYIKFYADINAINLPDIKKNECTCK